MDFLDLHTHQAADRPGVRAIRSVFFDEKKWGSIVGRDANNGQRDANNGHENNFRTAKTDLAQPIFSVGIHPWHLPMDLEAAMKWLRFEAAQDDVLAVGEAGLDHAAATDFYEQGEAFMACARLAEELEKPLIIHCVRANDEILAFKKMLRPAQPWIMHGFGGHPNTAKQLVENGFYLSFGHAILQNEKAAASLAAVPADRFFLETDDRQNLIIEDVYGAAAQIRGCRVEWLQGQVWGNFSGAFGMFAAVNLTV